MFFVHHWYRILFIATNISGVGLLLIYKAFSFGLSKGIATLLSSLETTIYTVKPA